MANIHPFRALRYTADAGPIATLTTLPYDVIPAALEAEYKARSPYNFAHLILPGGDYAGAGARLRLWLDTGILGFEDNPGIWVYEQGFPAPDTGKWLVRRGFTALGDTEEYGRRVFPHERTISGPKEDRFRLLQSTRVQFDAIFMLHDDPDGTVEVLLARATVNQPDIEYTDHEETLHRLWRVTDPDWIKTCQETMRGRVLMIADGHHRYETALRMGQPKTLMTFVAVQSPGLRSYATHRLVHGLPDFQAPEFLGALPGLGAGLVWPSPPDVCRIGVVTTAGLHHADLHCPSGGLNVELLQDHILSPILGLTPNEVAAGHHLRYVKKRSEAEAEVRAGRAQIAFLLEDLPVVNVMQAALRGKVLPQKSTFFYPKLGSGAILYALDQG
jgi:uncharacterized protein (DUF1015 family)